MLRALERAGYVEQLAESKEYRLTLKLFELGSRVASRTTLRDLAAVEVDRLGQQAGLASNGVQTPWIASFTASATQGPRALAALTCTLQSIVVFAE
jgi:hypothetical protein